jgi:hypothetical protein
MYLQKGILVCSAFVNVKFNGVLKFAGTVNIRGFDTFWSRKSREDGYRVSDGSTLKLSVRRRSCGVYIYYVKEHRVSH